MEVYWNTKEVNSCPSRRCHRDRLGRKGVFDETASAGTDISTETRNEIRASQDFEKLGNLVQELVGQTCLRAEFSYGDELELHFGEEQPYHSPKLAGKKRGSWVLEGFATPWTYSVNGTPHTGLLVGFVWFPPDTIPVPKQVVDANLADLSGTKVERVAVSTKSELTLLFSNGRVLHLFSRSAEPDSDMPVWELLTPHGTFYQVWGDPLPTWSLLRSDVSQSA
jgi:hypothetical protein